MSFTISSGVEFEQFDRPSKRSKSSSQGLSIKLHLAPGPPLIDPNTAPVRIVHGESKDGEENKDWSSLFREMSRPFFNGLDWI